MHHASAPPKPPDFSLHDQLLRETTVMVRYALASGRAVPASVVQTVEGFARAAPGAPPADLTPLVQAHQKLAKVVAPATPRALVLLAGIDQDGRASVMMTVPLVRRLIIAASVSLVLFILSSLSPMVNRVAGEPISQSGLALLTNEVFWLTSAALGGSFAMLFQINQYIADRTYDAKYEPAYWTKLMLGVIAGLILASLVPMSTAEGARELAKPTLAMLGGFSASAVYRILTRLVETVESLFQGDPREESSRVASQATAAANDEAGRQRMKVAGSLVELQQRIAAGATPQEVADALKATVRTLTDPSADDGEETPPAVAPAADAPEAPSSAPDAPSPAAEDGAVSTPPPGTVAVPAIAPVG